MLATLQRKAKRMVNVDSRESFVAVCRRTRLVLRATSRVSDVGLSKRSSRPLVNGVGWPWRKCNVVNAQLLTYLAVQV